jgi:DNA polymerase II small subunit
MSAEQKLQKAIETTIAAGYQLNSEAFEFLIQNAQSSDPLSIMNLALQRMETLQEKPFFIERSFLEDVLQQAIAVPEVTLEPPPPEIESYPLPQAPSYPKPAIIREDEAAEAFYPYAKYVPSELQILEDPTGKLTSNGTLDEYVGLFQDRFKRIEKLLRQRMDVRAATPIAEALKSQPKTKLKIICMLTEKRDSKNNMILSVEDLNASATILIPQKAPEEVKKKALRLLPDTVFCAAVIKTRTNLLMAEDIILPEIGRKPPQQHAQEPIYAVLTSDIHVGSTKYNKQAFKNFIMWLRGKWGTPQQREIAGRVKYLLIAGDIVDGVGIYPDQQKELTIRDVHKQYNFAAKYLEKVPSYIEIVIAPGNHDAARKSQPQPAIPKGYLTAIEGKENIHSVGSPCYLSLHGVEVLMYHGVSLNDIIGVVPGMDNDHPQNSMRLLMQSRHLAPVYGGKTMLSPENRDFMVVDKVPDIFHAGHIHVIGYFNYRGVLVVNSGGWQEQTEYMEKLGLMPTPGRVPVVNLQTLETIEFDFNKPSV